VSSHYWEGHLTSTQDKHFIDLAFAPVRIDYVIEFDYRSVHCVWAIREFGHEGIIIKTSWGG
jgi:carbamoyl-phosphate synthase large subunit